MKRYIKSCLSVLLFSLLLVLAACGTDTSNGDVSSDVDSDVETEQFGDAIPESETPPQAAEELTLADGEAKLIYHDGAYIAAVYHGPYKDIGATFTDGSDMEPIFVGYGHPSDGWTIVQSNEFPEDYTGEIFLSVTDYDAEKTEDGTYQEALYNLTDVLTKDEAMEIGLDIIADHICTIGTDKPTYGWDNFTAPFIYITFLDEYYNQQLEETDKLIDDFFSYYAEDGTPLEECFEEYTMKREPLSYGVVIKIYFYNNDTSGQNSEQNEEMCDRLRELDPYALYTAEDGTTRKIPFFNAE